MKDILHDINQWHKEGLKVAIARVIDAEGSGPREEGAAMAVNERSEVTGSVSGGCVESALVLKGLETIETGAAQLVTFGFSDDEAFSVGLTCGGTVHLYIERFDSQPTELEAELFDTYQKAVLNGDAVCLVSVIEGEHLGKKLLVRPGVETLGTLGNSELDRVIQREALAELEIGRSVTRWYGECGEQRENTLRVFFESHAPPPVMVIFGAVDFTAGLASVASVIGFKVIVADARPVFATEKRFPMADEIMVMWPDAVFDEIGASLGSRDAVAILTHDAKYDVPAVIRALKTNVGYIGVMGSRRTHDKRTERLIEVGVSKLDLERLHSPIGIDIGGRTPEETAISICAEIIANRSGRQVASLKDTTGPIH